MAGRYSKGEKPGVANLLRLNGEMLPILGLVAGTSVALILKGK
jgi:hypothetical protein